MKKANRVSQAVLERYYYNDVSVEERKLVEASLFSDPELNAQYESLKKTDEELRRQYPLESMPRIYAIRDVVVPVSIPTGTQGKEFERSWPQGRNRLWNRPLIKGIGAAAAILIIAFLALFILSRRINTGTVNEDMINEDMIVEESAPDINTEDGTGFMENEPNKKIVVPSEQPAGREGGNLRTEPDKPEIAETPTNGLHTEPGRTTEPDLRIDPDSGVSVAAVPGQDTGVQFRGEGKTSEPGQSGTPAAVAEGRSSTPAEPSNINIPPGITFIFDNMFANKGLTFVIIPARISSIGRNAFLGNPLVSVTIGANVFVEDTAIPGNFAAFYNANGKAAGTYTRTGVNSEIWKKK